MKEIDVPVEGGLLRVVEWPGDGPPVIGVHGITANALSWAAVARELHGRVRLVAPDLRGRALSAGLPGPYGMATHAADMIAIADHYGLPSVAIAGHSMGGFVATATAERHPDRVSSVLLIDGGVALGIPPGIDPDDALRLTIGAALDRLAMTFPTLADYLRFFAGNPALGRYWSDDVTGYVARDYVGTGSSCHRDAIRADARDMFTEPDRSAGLPLLWAPRGLQDQEGGLYAADQLAGVDAELVPDVNHYSILLGPGASRVADRIVQLT